MYSQGVVGQFHTESRGAPKVSGSANAGSSGQLSAQLTDGDELTRLFESISCRIAEGLDYLSPSIRHEVEKQERAG